ncbi:hypothetical protein [Actinomyces oris]|uniref:Uncharacterized protein n=1 Tax=Actinomyces oris TaxID=544580 RepID=A0AAW8L647_9ACTO|nr:hypothetical protein [Actinomyces oris]MDR0177019.1 hypothetical protein [Actinomyces oris]
MVVMGGGADGGEWCTGVVSAGAGTTSCGSSLFREWSRSSEATAARGRQRRRPELLLGDEAADAACAEIAEHGTISWDGVKTNLGIEGAVGLREVTSLVCGDP